MNEDQGRKDENRRLIARHFEEFVNRRDLDAIARNMAADRAMMAAMHDRFPDLRIDLKDIVAQGDKVVVRAFWGGTDAYSGRRMEMRGFVLWRIADGLIVERWATVTPMRDAEQAGTAW
jgi:ketosteroid isomerase-like protein